MKAKEWQEKVKMYLGALIYIDKNYGLSYIKIFS